MTTAEAKLKLRGSGKTQWMFAKFLNVSEMTISRRFRAAELSADMENKLNEFLKEGEADADH